MKYKVEVFVKNANWSVIYSTKSINIAFAHFINLKTMYPDKHFRIVKLLVIS